MSDLAVSALSDLLRAANPFAALGRSIEGHDPADPLFAYAAVKLDITAGDAQAIRAAHDRAISPVDTFREAARYVTLKWPQGAQAVIRRIPLKLDGHLRSAYTHYSEA